MKSMNRQIIISILISALMVGWSLWFVSRKSGSAVNPLDTSPVSFSEGRQLIDIRAKGGYLPRIISAKAGLPTILRMKTNNTYDCSASLVIPNLFYQNFLPPTGITEIEISADQARGTLRGLCSMGMYGFRIDFK